MRVSGLIVSILVLVIVASCDKDLKLPNDEVANTEGQPTPYFFKVPENFPAPNLPEDNLLTIEGIELGRKLFYDEILSRDNTISCASCHNQESAFTDDLETSVGIRGQLVSRNSMALFNLAWHPFLFWDGRAADLREQVLAVVPNPVEMDLTWPEAINRLNKHPEYPSLFQKAYPNEPISKELVAKAIEQFELIIISSDSKFDKVQRGEASFTELEIRGKGLVESETGDCFVHCHDPTFPGNKMILTNNGLDSLQNATDLGVYEVTNDPTEKLFFKAPSLRNISHSAPYMHDGRFGSLEDVLEHYVQGVTYSPTIAGVMFTRDSSIVGGPLGMQLNGPQQEAIIEYLKTFDDPTFLTNPAYSDPDL